MVTFCYSFQSPLKNGRMDTTPFFEYYYNNAEVNSIIIMDSKGIIVDVNSAFISNFGYNKDDLLGSNFDALFTQADQKKGKPINELRTVLSTGQAHDENYLLNKNADPVWCTGESILAISKEGEKFVIKDIVNLQSKKQLQLFLHGADELLERIFTSSKDIPMMIVDGSLKVQRVNSAFADLFEITAYPKPGSRLQEIDHDLWKTGDIKAQVRKVLIDNMPVTDLEISFNTKSGQQKRVLINSKFIERPSQLGRQLFIIFEDITGR